jgi:peptidyl-prolyl cis-trans isomerase A (cyclophilin A)
MRTFLLIVISGAVAFAQAPAPPKPAPPARAGTKTGARRSAAAKAPATTGPTAAQTAKLMNPAALKAVAPPDYKAKFTTMKDQNFVIEVHRDWAPLGADRFYNLVRNGFFTGVRFYRVSPGFVVQFGVSPNPKITQAWSAAKIHDDPVKEHNTKGTITFAMGGPNTRTTQLFINLRDNSMLDAMGFAPLGTVVEGMEAVEGLYSGYGEIAEQGGTGPKQELVMKEGEKYLKTKFDNLDTIKSATVISPTAAPPVKKTWPVPKKSATK